MKNQIKISFMIFFISLLSLPSIVFAASSIGNVSVSPIHYTVDVFQSNQNPLKLSFDYQGMQSGNDNVLVEIYPKNNPSNVVFSRSFSNLSGSGQKSIDWTGQIDNSSFYANNGTYTMEISGWNNSGQYSSQYKDFTLTQTPSLSIPVVIQNPYNPFIGPLIYNYAIFGLPPNTTRNITVSIINTSGQTVYSQTYNQGTGFYENVWTDNNALQQLPAGNYFLRISGALDGQTITRESNQFTVSPTLNTGTTISNLGITPSTYYGSQQGYFYNPNQGNLQLRYYVTNPMNTQLNVQLLGPSNNVIQSWSNLSPVTGYNTLTYNQSASLTPGAYTFRVSGTSGSQTLTSQQFTFTVPGTSNMIITDMSVSPSPYLSGQGAASIKYRITNPENKNITLRIYNPQNQLIHETTLSNPQSGLHTYNWNAPNNLANGKYTLRFNWAGQNQTTQKAEYQFNVGTATTEMRFTDISVTPSPYDPTKGPATIRYRVTNPENKDITLRIYDSRDRVIRTVNLQKPQSGMNTYTWSAPNTLANGQYFLWFTWSGQDLDTQEAKHEFTIRRTVAQINCGNFTDITQTSPYCEAISWVRSEGIMTGNPDGSFQSNTPLQRDQIAKIVVEAFREFDPNRDYCNGRNPFPDVPLSSWSANYICLAKSVGMVTGYKAGPERGRYVPSRPINRAEFLTLALRNVDISSPHINYYRDVPRNTWYTKYADYSFQNKLFPDYSDLQPTKIVTRGEVAMVLYRLHQLGKL